MAIHIIFSIHACDFSRYEIINTKLFPFFTSSGLTGYLEDRRPASNMDPYIVTGLLAETTILWEPTLEAEALAAKKLALNV